MKIISVEVSSGIPRDSTTTNHPRARSVTGAIRSRFKMRGHFGIVTWTDGNNTLPIHEFTQDGRMLPAHRETVLGNRFGLMCRVG